MNAEQYHRILTALERTAELLQDPERAARAARLLVYPNCESLQRDVNDLREAIRENRLFIVDVLDGLPDPLPDIDELEPLDLSELPPLNKLEPLNFDLE